MDLTRVLTAATPQRMAVLRLQSDVYWNKMKTEEKRYYRDASVEIGEKTAALYQIEHALTRMSELIEQYDLKVLEEETATLTGIHPKVDRKRKKITVDPAYLSDTLRMLKEIIPDITGPAIIRMVTMKGFYTFYASGKEMLATETLKPLVVRQLGFLRTEESVDRTDDAAGDRFATLTSDFPVPVGLLPYLKWIESGHATEKQLLQLLESEEVNL